MWCSGALGASPSRTEQLTWYKKKKKCGSNRTEMGCSWVKVIQVSFASTKPSDCDRHTANHDQASFFCFVLGGFQPFVTVKDPKMMSVRNCTARWTPGLNVPQGLQRSDQSSMFFFRGSRLACQKIHKVVPLGCLGLGLKWLRASVQKRGCSVETGQALKNGMSPQFPALIPEYKTKQSSSGSSAVSLPGHQMTMWYLKEDKRGDESMRDFGEAQLYPGSKVDLKKKMCEVVARKVERYRIRMCFTLEGG